MILQPTSARWHSRRHRCKNDPLEGLMILQHHHTRKACIRRCRLDGDGGVSTLLLHFGAQTLHAQVSP